MTDTLSKLLAARNKLRNMPSEPTTLAELLEEYAPYNRMQAFREGFIAGKENPYNPDSVEAQAWDRGAEAAMRWERMQQ